MEDEKRRLEAGVPSELTFAMKPELGLEMIKNATSAGVPYQWVTGDCAYGDYDAMRSWLEANGKSYVLNVSRNEPMGIANIGAVLKWLPEEDGWFDMNKYER